MSYKIDVIDPKEYSEIVEVWESSVRATHHFLSEADIQFFKPLILNEYLAAVKLACSRNNDTGRIVGFVGVADDKLEMLFIHPDQRGAGIGKQLLNHAIDEMKIKYVDVNEDNLQAVGFYEHLGFTCFKRSELDGMGKPFPLLHMQLNR